MPFDLKPKNPSDLIRSEEWNKIINQLYYLNDYDVRLEKDLSGLKTRIDGLEKKDNDLGRKVADLEIIIGKNIDNINKEIRGLKRFVTLTSLEATEGFYDPPLDLTYSTKWGYNYGYDVVGLITKQYVRTNNGGICTFGIDDFVDFICYWASADKDTEKALSISLNYWDHSDYNSDLLFINKWESMSGEGVKNEKNPYISSISGGSTSNKYFYKYIFQNPNSSKRVRSIGFVKKTSDGIVRVGNVLQYGTSILDKADK
jgi:hypothetical protein